MDERKEQAVISPKTQKFLRRKDRTKAIRTTVQIVLLCLFAAWGVRSVLPERQMNLVDPDDVDAYGLSRDTPMGNHFIALSYPGLTTSQRLSSRVVNNTEFQKQMDALRASGYVTISQEDIRDFYLYGKVLPSKSLFLVFEDGIRDTPALAQKALDKHGYRATVCTYANSLNERRTKYITASDLRSLLKNQRWELGTNGYRLSYINVYDRYGNYFGHLNGNEYVSIYTHLWRDYNHYLMDYKRDEDRLRQENEAQLRARISKDYELMGAAYREAVGFVPGLYILMHSNTGAFGTHPVASNANRDGMYSLFTMNFNRQGTCLNTRDSSIYDLSRLQVQSYFSTNHLLMRIWDDTGAHLSFVTGDEEAAQDWYLDDGVAEYGKDRIILTSNPRGRGHITLKHQLFSDLDLTVTLQGNLLGSQSVYLRTDRTFLQGIQVALEDNHIVVRNLGGERRELLHQDLMNFDGGPFLSVQEDEYNGLVALQEALIAFDEDPQRVAVASAELSRLNELQPLSLTLGGTPFYPPVDLADRGSRILRIRLEGSRLSIWVDGHCVAERLQVQVPLFGSLALGAEVFPGMERSQRFIYDDVYDAVFVNLVIRHPQEMERMLYKYERASRETLNTRIITWVRSIVEFIGDYF